MHGVEPHRAGGKPALAERRLQLVFRLRSAGHAAQALDGGDVRAALGIFQPLVVEGRRRKVGKHQKALLLRIDQMQPVALARHVMHARGQHRRARRTLQPRQFLALHEVEHGHQQARNLGIAGAVGRLEHQRHAAGNQTHKRRRAFLRSGRQRLHVLAQRRQRIQPLQQIGDRIEQPRRMATGQRQLLVGLQLAAHIGNRRIHFEDLRRQRRRALHTGAGQQQIRQSALLLQLMDQSGRSRDQ